MKLFLSCNLYLTPRNQPAHKTEGFRHQLGLQTVNFVEIERNKRSDLKN